MRNDNYTIISLLTRIHLVVVRLPSERSLSRLMCSSIQRSFPLPVSLSSRYCLREEKASALVAAGGANGLPRLRWPSGFREVVETTVLPPVGGGRPSSVRVRFPAVASSSWNKVLPRSPPPRWCSTPASVASPWRWCSRRGAPVQESSAGDSSIQREGEFVGF